MSTQAALEEQVYASLLDVNGYRLEAHTAATAADLNATYAAFENMISQARRGKHALDKLMDLKEDERLEELEAWQDEHHWTECEPNDCTRDHDEEIADTAAETAWEIERDLA